MTHWIKNTGLGSVAAFGIALFSTPMAAAQTSSEHWIFGSDSQSAPWQTTSCPPGTAYFPKALLEIKSSPIELGKPEDIDAALPSFVRFTGGWHLSAKTPDFGGLSGLALKESGDLLAVTDRGFFVQITMENGAPNGSGTLSPMLDAEGQFLSGKVNTDAEGLTYKNGLALVSFERNHRILGFDLKACGAAARGVLIRTLPDKVGDTTLKPNGGAESLAHTKEGQLVAGFETSEKSKTWLLQIDENSEKETLLGLERPPKHKLVGLDANAVLFRAYDKKKGNRNTIALIESDQTADGFESPTAEMTKNTLRRFALKPPLNVDNFEGVAITQNTKSSGGGQTLYMISDDNFSNRQRTLLYRFEITP